MATFIFQNRYRRMTYGKVLKTVTKTWHMVTEIIQTRQCRLRYGDVNVL